MKRISLAVLALLVVLALGAAWWLSEHYQAQLDTPMALDASERFQLEPGQGLRSVSRTFAERGWVDSAWVLEAYGRRQGIAPRLQAGEYAVTPGMTPRELIHAMARGEVVQHRLTFPEGWTIRQALAALREHPELIGPAESVGVDNLLEALGLEDLGHPEGWFLPDTYFFGSGTEALAVLQRAHQAMRLHLDRAWEDRIEDHPVKSPYELLILASIIERETGRGDERDRVAGVFVNRLKRGMRLQTDPTLLYAQEPGVQRLTRAELDRDHPYNTYTRAGLPPTPIALPGRAALQAAARPAETNDLFFVSRGDGSHHFSETYREHREAVIRYQLGGDGSRYGIRNR
ncbi:aminodeoxychorismate lyase [Thioalkalivibrio versutus]|uniref:Endolytic murein transglycosylase n=1 Tax=Thioalkalivibrio versutus TaxID=106634 RepID=A0A0G3G6D7_9GAMM|nr:endolytic transglycosylase MltG [Thioalkalivibrio versutus]AKJ95067.1 aminodeoxychorismate lyase [Thioalkalivibrio versutus]